MSPKKTIKKGLSYAEAGVDINIADDTKETIAKTLQSGDKRILNSVGSWAFASLVDGKFGDYKEPVLVLKTEEPGSKQLLAFQHGRVQSICEDMINHLVNDIAVMGATPLYVQDAVICGKLEKKVVTEIVKSIANACKAQGCILTGGETSEQPGVLQPGVYVLTSSIIGIVEKSKVIDGSSISEGDTILAIASNGLHTNGYTLVRALMKENPALAEKKIGEETFLDAILKPHVCYFQAIKTLFDDADLHGMAHITGSGIEGNLERILPKNLDAQIDLSTLRVLPIFNTIQKEGNVSDSEMLRTYNMGVGLTLVVKSSATARIMTQIKKLGHDCYPVGNIVTGKAKVKLSDAIHWPS